jgi:hypothetical protein
MGTKGDLAKAFATLISVLWNEQYTFLSPVTFRVSKCSHVAPYGDFLTLRIHAEIHLHLRAIFRRNRSTRLSGILEFSSRRFARGSEQNSDKAAPGRDEP